MNRLLIKWLLCAAALFCLLPSEISAQSSSKPPTVVLISGEYEYSSMLTLPALKDHLERQYGFKCIYLQRAPEESIPGLEALERADLAILYIRRMTLPQDQLDRFKRYVQSGKPLVGLRTTSHAFENWKEWDNKVLGGNYHNHYGNQFVATASIHPAAEGHPILKNVPKQFVTGGSLYKTSPLAEAARPLLMGSIPNQPAEPMAWTHEFNGGRIFYTSLGDAKDFMNPAFTQLLVNGIFWSLDRPAPKAAEKVPALGPFPPMKIGLGEFEKLASHKRFKVLDVRTPEEFAAGHVQGAVNIPISAPDFAQRLAALDKTEPYVLHCARGGRSARAAEQMKQLKFPFLYDFSGGMEAWEKAGKKVVK